MIWKKVSKILTTCPKGVAPYLKAEILNLGFPVQAELDTAIQTEGTLEDTMILNLHLRTAQRVLYLLDKFSAKELKALNDHLRTIPWETLLSATGRAAYLCVTSAADNISINDSRFLNMKVKDTIVDRMRNKCGMRPDSGPARDKAVVHIYWKNDQAEIYLDTSGERLSKRGYRKISLQAPMQETLAAALILATGWQGDKAFLNPMCGSGTIAIEAALIALKRAPGLLRNNYGFMYIKGFPDQLWLKIRQQAKDAIWKKPAVKIIATDIDKTAVQAAQSNAQTAGVDHLIDFFTCPFTETFIPAGGGVIVLNPPYGERMEASGNIQAPCSKRKAVKAGAKIIIRKAVAGAERTNHRASANYNRLSELYQSIGDFFKKNCGGYEGYIFTGNLEMIKKVGLRTNRRIIMYNGEIECRLLAYELYEGSRK